MEGTGINEGERGEWRRERKREGKKEEERDRGGSVCV